MTTRSILPTFLWLLAPLGCASIAPADAPPSPRPAGGKLDGTTETVAHGALAFDEEQGAELAAGVAHAWTLSLAEPAEVSLATTVAWDDLDTVLYVHDAAGTEVARDDDGGEGRASAVTVSLAEGDHTVTVVGFDEAAVGPFTIVARCVACARTEPAADPWAGARDVHAHRVAFDESTPIPAAYTRPSGVSPVSLSSPEWWQRWSGGVTRSFAWDAGSDYGKRCGVASALRLEAIHAHEETGEDGETRRPGRDAFEALLSGSGWRGTMYNWTEDVSAGGRPIFSGATMWAWRTTGVKFVHVVHPDGSCELPTLGLVQEFSERCLSRAAAGGGEIQGCRATAG